EMDIPGGKPARITSGAEREYMPAWSPNGQWIAYVTWSTEAGGRIWKKSANGQGQAQQLTRVAAYYQDPEWSPDGSRIVALRSSRQDRVAALGSFGGQSGMDLVWVPASGGDASVIVPARGVGHPHFTSDKERIYVYSP